MKMYDLIAENYSGIFPPDKDRTDFVLSYLTGTRGAILDAGCATGDLCIALAGAGCAALTGIDLNSKMIAIAKENAGKKKLNIDFRVMNILGIDCRQTFECVLCFGNTLPHLGSVEEISSFFGKVHEALVPGGYFIFQILNYDRILSEKKANFPAVDNERFLFKREYEFSGKDAIIFRIYFTDKSSGQTCSDSTLLLPVKCGDIKRLLYESGFYDLNIYSDYDRSASDMTEFVSVYVAQK